MNRRKAFTLVELLVVISIIALLLSILMPSLQKAKMAAQRVVCMNQDRQQVAMQLTYATDSKGKFPPFRTTEPWTVSENWSFKTLAVHEIYKPYMGAGASKMLICPFTKRFGYQNPTTWGMFMDTKWHYGDCGAWDAVNPAAPSFASLKQFKYTWIPYNWFMGFESTVDGQWDWRDGEKPWAKTLPQASALTAAIAHIYNSSSQHSLNKYRDLSHGGDCTKWGQSPERQNIDRKNGTLDNPVAYGDGHVEYHVRPTGAQAYKSGSSTKMRIRVYYPAKVGQVSVCY